MKRIPSRILGGWILACARMTKRKEKMDSRLRENDKKGEWQKGGKTEKAKSKGAGGAIASYFDKLSKTRAVIPSV